MKYEFTYESLQKLYGQDPSLDTVIRLLGDTEENEGDGSSSTSVGPVDLFDKNSEKISSTGIIGINITRNGIDLTDLSDPDDIVSIGSVRLFNDTDLLLIIRYLKAYLLTNEDVLSSFEKSILNHLIKLF